MSGPRSDHADHDEALVAAYAAGDLAEADLARAEALVAGCPDCGRLVDDLRAIAAATRALPAPARPRDFRLTAGDAARASVTREPSAAATRHSGVDPRRPLPTDHAEHDEALVAAYAAGDLSGPELARAEALTSACPACAELATDLVAIAATTRTLPAPARSRDFRLSAHDAARLRRTSRVWRLRGFGRTVLRPVALGLTTIGLAGLLIGVAAPGNTAIFGSAGGTPTNDRTSSMSESRSGGTASPASGAGDLSGKDSAASPPVPAAVSHPSPTQATQAPGGPQTTPTTPAAVSGGPSPLTALSSLVLVLGLLLLVVPVLQSRRRRRARDDPG